MRREQLANFIYVSDLQFLQKTTESYLMLRLNSQRKSINEIDLEIGKL